MEGRRKAKHNQQSKILSDCMWSSNALVRITKPLYKEFPAFTAVSFDLVETSILCTRIDTVDIPRAFFSLLKRFERALNYGVGFLQLNEQTPKKLQKCSSYLEHQVQNISLYGNLYGLTSTDENYTQLLRSCLVVILKHFINVKLIAFSVDDYPPNKFNSNSAKSKNEAGRIYRFMKSVLAISSVGTTGSDMLDIFLLSNLCQQGQPYTDLGFDLLEELLGDIRIPSFFTSCGVSVLKFLAILKVYDLERTKAFGKKNNSYRYGLYSKIIPVVRRLKLREFEDLEAAVSLCKVFGKTNFSKLYEKIKISRIIGAAAEHVTIIRTIPKRFKTPKNPISVNQKEQEHPVEPFFFTDADSQCGESLVGPELDMGNSSDPNQQLYTLVIPLQAEGNDETDKIEEDEEEPLSDDEETRMLIATDMDNQTGMLNGVHDIKITAGLHVDLNKNIALKNGYHDTEEYYQQSNSKVENNVGRSDKEDKQQEEVKQITQFEEDEEEEDVEEEEEVAEGEEDDMSSYGGAEVFDESELQCDLGNTYYAGEDYGSSQGSEHVNSYARRHEVQNEEQDEVQDEVQDEEQHEVQDEVQEKVEGDVKNEQPESDDEISVLYEDVAKTGNLEITTVQQQCMVTAIPVQVQRPVVLLEDRDEADADPVEAYFITEAAAKEAARRRGLLPDVSDVEEDEEL